VVAQRSQFPIAGDRGGTPHACSKRGALVLEARVSLRPTRIKRIAPGTGSGTAVVERPFIDEMRAVEKLLPIPPDAINRRVLEARLADADIDVAERLSEMNLRYYDTVVRPLLDEWRREVRMRRIGQAVGFVAACVALGAGTRASGTAAYVLFFVGTFGFCTAIAAWYGSAAASAGIGLAARLSRRISARDGGST
jgi:hypothetical protein